MTDNKIGIDFAGPINRHLDVANAKLDALIDELAYSPEELAEIREQRAKEADPMYLLGSLVGEFNRSLRDMADRFAAGVRGVK